MTVAATATLAGLVLVFGNPWVTRYFFTNHGLLNSEAFQQVAATLGFSAWSLPGLLARVSNGLLLVTALRAFLVVALSALFLLVAGLLIGKKPRGVGVVLLVWGVVILASALVGLLISPLLRLALPVFTLQLLVRDIGRQPTYYFAVRQLTLGAGYGFLVGWAPAVVAALLTRAPAVEDGRDHTPVRSWTARFAWTGIGAVIALVLVLGNPWLTRFPLAARLGFDGIRFSRGPGIVLQPLRLAQWGIPGVVPSSAPKFVLVEDLQALLVVLAVGGALALLGHSFRPRRPALSVVLPVWGTVALAAGFVAAVVEPLFVALDPFPLRLSEVVARTFVASSNGAVYGVLAGWVPALLVMLVMLVAGRRPERSPLAR